MNKRKKRSFVFVLKMWLLLSCCIQLRSAPQLMKVFYHTGGLADIELGKIVFYFSKDTPLQVPKIDKKTSQSIAFTFDGATAHQTVVDAAKTLLKGIDRSICTAQLTVTRGTKPSISLHITYNPAAIGFESALFDAIQHEKGFVCTFLNRILLDRLSEKNNILRTVSDTRPRGIVIDMGHGGNDHGAVSVHGIPEKEITRGLGFRLSDLLRAQGFTVFYTRSDDSFVPLDARTSFFNACHTADILISIHANSGGPHSCGVETFCYKPLRIPHVFFDSLSMQERSVRATTSQSCFDHSTVLAQLVQDSVITQVKKNNNWWLIVA